MMSGGPRLEAPGWRQGPQAGGRMMSGGPRLEARAPGWRTHDVWRPQAGGKVEARAPGWRHQAGGKGPRLEAPGWRTHDAPSTVTFTSTPIGSRLPRRRTQEPSMGRRC